MALTTLAARTIYTVVLGTALGLTAAAQTPARNASPVMPSGNTSAPAPVTQSPVSQQGTAKPVPGNASAGKPAPSSVPAGMQKGALAPPVIPPGVPTSPDFVFGPGDTLLVMIWREKDLSAEVSVRPDGKISLPLINDVQAAGLTPDQLRVRVAELASAFVEEPTVSVVVRAVVSRNVFVTGSVNRPGAFPLPGPTSVMQLIVMAGGLSEFADSEDISIMRTEGGRQTRLRFNFKDYARGKNLNQNIELKPGDIVIVP